MKLYRAKHPCGGVHVYINHIGIKKKFNNIDRNTKFCSMI